MGWLRVQVDWEKPGEQQVSRKLHPQMIISASNQKSLVPKIAPLVTLHVQGGPHECAQEGSAQSHPAPGEVSRHTPRGEPWAPTVRAPFPTRSRSLVLRGTLVKGSHRFKKLPEQGRHSSFCFGPHTAHPTTCPHPHTVHFLRHRHRLWTWVPDLELPLESNPHNVERNRNLPATL